MTEYQGPFAAMAANAGWTLFYDMHSGGHRKLQWDFILIQAAEEEALIIFQNKFDQDPKGHSCPCCSSDYTINFYKTLEEAKGYWPESGTRKPELIVFANQISDEERKP